jgi:hypothetical protein
VNIVALDNRCNWQSIVIDREWEEDGKVDSFELA